ncbi:MAG: thiamine-phosphate kinase [candidate division WOR-3 bacterium]
MNAETSCKAADFCVTSAMRPPVSSESRLIRMIQRTVQARAKVRVGIGDDACVLTDGTVLTTDAYAEGVHFELSLLSWYEVGFRCACAALSDIVAMGAEPDVLIVALTLPKNTALSDVRRLYQGIDTVCARLGCEVAGGDTIAGDRLLLALTALGKTDRPRLRSDAQTGEALYVTGFLGSAETGRLALKYRLNSSTYAQSIERHKRPFPRFHVMRALSRRIRALIDTSDGIATDARHLAESSGRRIVLEPRLFPILPETIKLCKKLRLDPTRFALCSGEDYELLFTARGRIPTAAADVHVTRIGRVESGRGLYLEQDGKLAPVRFHGYDHLTVQK